MGQIYELPSGGKGDLQELCEWLLQDLSLWTIEDIDALVVYLDEGSDDVESETLEQVKQFLAKLDFINPIQDDKN